MDLGGKVVPVMPIVRPRLLENRCKRYWRARLVLKPALRTQGAQADIWQEFSVPPSPFFEDVQVATDGRVFFLTRNGSMGLGPASMRNGDTIHVLPSGRAHFVLRRGYSGLRNLDQNVSKWIESLKFGQYELIGDCYLHTGATFNDRTSTDQEPVVEGSLPFEMLGARYWRETGLPSRETVILV